MLYLLKIVCNLVSSLYVVHSIQVSLFNMFQFPFVMNLQHVYETGQLIRFPFLTIKLIRCTWIFFFAGGLSTHVIVCLKYTGSNRKRFLSE